MKKNPEIKKSIDKIKNILEKTKLELKNWKVTDELKNNFGEIKKDIEKIQNILAK
jgi:DNA-binding transcriptional regulator GbsR (MarR family)